MPLLERRRHTQSTLFSLPTDVSEKSIELSEEAQVQAMFDKLAAAYSKEKAKIDQLTTSRSYRSGTTKRLFSLYKTFNIEKGDYMPSMHVYKRNLSPIRECYPQCNTETPYSDNFLVFSSSEGGLFDIMTRFKQQYLTSNENVKVNSKNKNFQTFSVVDPWQPKRSQTVLVKSDSTVVQHIKRNSSF